MSQLPLFAVENGYTITQRRDDTPDWGWTILDDQGQWITQHEFRSLDRALGWPPAREGLRAWIGIRVDGEQPWVVDATEVLLSWARTNYRTRVAWLVEHKALPPVMLQIADFCLSYDGDEWVGQALKATDAYQELKEDHYHILLGHPMLNMAYSLSLANQTISVVHEARCINSPHWGAFGMYMLTPPLDRSLIDVIRPLFDGVPLPHGGELPYDPTRPVQISYSAWGGQYAHKPWRSAHRSVDEALQAAQRARLDQEATDVRITHWLSSKPADYDKPRIRGR